VAAREKGLLKIEDRVLVAWVRQVDEVVWYQTSADLVVRQVLARANVHASVDLARVCTDHLAGDRMGEMSRECGFPRRRRAEDADQQAAFRHEMASSSSCCFVDWAVRSPLVARLPSVCP